MFRAFAIGIAALVAVTAIARSELHPIISIEDGLFLGSAGEDQWVSFEKARRAVKGGETYRLYSLTEALGTAKGGKPESAGEPCLDMLVIPLRPKPTAGVIALAGAWNALPRVPRSLAVSQPIYQKTVADFLTARGISKPKVKITQILRIDLEGDGEEEVLISATNYFTKDGSVPSGAVAGSYSCILLRRVIAGKVQTQLVAGDFHPTAKTFNAPYQHEVGAVLDLTGSGQMEVIVHSAYYEGSETSIFRCTGKKPEQVLSAGCGA